MNIKKLIQNIFSIRNCENKTHKILTILGFKLGIQKSKLKLAKEYIGNIINLKPKKKHINQTECIQECKEELTS